MRCLLQISLIFSLYLVQQNNIGRLKDRLNSENLLYFEHNKKYPEVIRIANVRTRRRKSTTEGRP
jgi:predicted ATPase